MEWTPSRTVIMLHLKLFKQNNTILRCSLPHTPAWTTLKPCRILLLKCGGGSRPFLKW